ncbi:cell wall-binding repeat-containing protein [Georgenia yuyongxinii]
MTTSDGVVRIGGADRYATAAAASKFAFPEADTVFITTGTQYADALSAGPAANRLRAPILLVQRVAIPLDVHLELQRLRPSTLYVLGGTGAVSASVENELKAYGRVIRLQGGDRYETSAAVGQTVWQSASAVYLASGQDFADGLSGGAAAAATGAPLYVTPQWHLHASIRAEVQRLGATRVVLLGGGGAVNANVERAVRSAVPGAVVTRLAGADRYETAGVIARATWPAGSPRAFVATGLQFADALTGVPAAGAVSAPVLLSGPRCLPVPANAALKELGIQEVTILGGAGVVSESALATVCG